MQEILIQFQNVTLGYDNKIVLKDLNFTIHDFRQEGVIKGQSICFISRSGRGKSTLFKALSGLLTPFSGNILVNHENTPVIAREGMIGFVDQHYTLFRHKTVEDTLMYALRKNKMPNKDKKDLINKELKDWHLEGMSNKYPNELSGGQKQRVAIIEKLLASNHYIIMDEPISGLDVIAIKQVKHNFEKLLSSHEKNTIIFSTHDLDFAIELADEIYVLGKNQSDYSCILQKFSFWNNVDSKFNVKEKIEKILQNS